MLDKSVPYAELKMHRKAGSPIPDFPLPQGFRFAMFQDGNETDWARIETSVGEFDTEFSALMRFKTDFMPHIEELRRRLVFIEAYSPNDAPAIKVATANAWWSMIDGKRRAWLHWVSVNPQYQGLGLGKALTAQVLKIMRDIDGDIDFWLSTQTWSYKAIDIYKKCGFEPTDEKILYGKKGDYKKALRILAALEAKRI